MLKKLYTNRLKLESQSESKGNQKVNIMFYHVNTLEYLIRISSINQKEKE